MKRVCIAIDSWKLAIFDAHLTRAGYAYERGPGVTADMLFLTVKTQDVKALDPVVRAANAEAKRARLH